jgi:peptidoglycan/xylan/chitin deacetylase (PgdA/CDA1 family)
MHLTRILKHNIGNIISKSYGSIFLRNQKGLKVLMYHNIKDSGNFDLYKIKFKSFKKQILHIKKNKKCSKVVNINEGMVSLANTILTFDDAYTNIYKKVFPFLLEHKIYFTIFVICRFLNTEHNEYISIEQLKEMSKSKYVTIGSHTYNHLNLCECNEKKMKYEIIESKKFLEDTIGKNVDYLSYPYGKYSNKIKKTVISAGYKAAFSSKFGFFNDLKEIYEIPRLDIWSTDNISSVNDKISGKWNWYS